jgi:hypothetical protein
MEPTFRRKRKPSLTVQPIFMRDQVLRQEKCGEHGQCSCPSRRHWHSTTNGLATQILALHSTDTFLSTLVVGMFNLPATQLRLIARRLCKSSGIAASAIRLFCRW